MLLCAHWEKGQRAHNMCRSSGGALVVLKKEIGANELKRSRIKAGRQVNKMGSASEQRSPCPGVGGPGL